MTAFDWFFAAFLYLGIGNAIVVPGHLRIKREGSGRFVDRNAQQRWGTRVGYTLIVLTWPIIVIYWLWEKVAFEIRLANRVEALRLHMLNAPL